MAEPGWSSALRVATQSQLCSLAPVEPQFPLGVSTHPYWPPPAIPMGYISIFQPFPHTPPCESSCRVENVTPSLKMGKLRRIKIFFSLLLRVKKEADTTALGLCV